MISDLIRDYLHAVPFQSFVIQMTDGRIFEVPHPDFAAVSPKGRTVFVYRGEGGAHLNTVLIASVQLAQTAGS